jgi:subtilisin family serine protease
VQPTFNGSGNREALERLFSPLAWGCSTGGNGVKVAAVDVDFRSYSDIPFNAILSRGVGSVATAVEHGTRVASILAARGNDTLGMTGVLWSADLRLYERTVGGQANTATSVQRVMRAFRDGARVVNLSTSLAQAWGSAALPWHGGTKADSGWVLAFATAYDNAMRVLKQAGLDPLLVVSAGNFTNISERDAFWAGWGRLKQLHPDNVLVVAATATNATALHPVTGRGPRVSVAALGEDVYSRSSASAVGTPLSGTSFSAPQVAGIAGLLFHFDPRLTAMDVMSLIASGAQRGGRSAGGIPLANAYESLKLAAERQGAPLCGNRVWTSAGTIRVQRGNTIETIPTVLSPSDTIRNIEVSHGGKRIDYTTYSTSGVPFVARALTWSGGVWSTSSLPPLSPHSSGTWLSTHGTSHDRDTAFVSEYTSGGSPSDPNHRITIDRQRLLGGPPTSDPVQIVIPSTGYVLPTGHTEHLPTNSPFGITAAFPVTGDTGLLAVSMYHILYTDTPAALFLQTWPQEARLYRVLLNTSPPTVQLVSTVADSAVYFLGLSEDGREKVMAVGRDSTSDLPGPTTSRTMIRCSLRWSRPRFSATAGQRFDDSTAARWTVQNAQPWPAQNQIPEGCPVEERNGGTLGSDLFGGGTIAPRVLPQWLQQRIRVPRVRGS